MDASSPWSRPETVGGFVRSPPNQTLLRFAAEERRRRGQDVRALDIGCGAARNAGPLADAGWEVWGVDTSRPMLEAAKGRVLQPGGRRLHLAEAAMTDLPFADRAFDLVIAHGVWNLATSDDELRRALREAARVSCEGAALFVFTFSRHTLPAEAAPLAHERYVYDQFSGTPQIFLTADQLVDELRGAGFEPDDLLPVTELNRPSGARLVATGPVIYEGAFRRRA